MCGVRLAFLFGTLVVLLNFVPTIGPIAAALLPLPLVKAVFVPVHLDLTSPPPPTPVCLSAVVSQRACANVQVLLDPTLGSAAKLIAPLAAVTLQALCAQALEPWLLGDVVALSPLVSTATAGRFFSTAFPTVSKAAGRRRGGHRSACSARRRAKAWLCASSAPA
eukprot:SAG25_NODE_199_length_12089_cov_86.323853_4_plen_165_part_00